MKVKFVRRQAKSSLVFTLGFFFLMALGPALQIDGRIVYDALMPYTILETILPFFKLSGVPIRMVIMVTLSASVLCAMAIARYYIVSSEGQSIYCMCLCWFYFSLNLCRTLAYRHHQIPQLYTHALSELPNDGGVLDLAAPTKYLQLYYQTKHHKPMVFGYVARTPSSVTEKEKGLNRPLTVGEYIRLWNEYQMGYIVTPDHDRI